MQDVGPSIFRRRSHQGGKVKVVAHLKRERSGGFKLGIGGVLVVECAHIKHRHGTDSNKWNAQSQQDHVLQTPT